MQNKLGYYFLGLVYMLSISCAQVPKSSSPPNFIGHVYEHKFNNMPMVDKPSSKGLPMNTTVYIYEATRVDQLKMLNQKGQMSIASSIQTKFIDSAISNKLGSFEFHLQPGKYSVFVKYDNGYYIPFFSGINWVSIIEIKANEVNSLDLEVNAIGSNE